MKVVNKPIEVISLIDYIGDMKPIKFKILDNNSDEYIQIERIIRRDKEKIDGIICTTYTCEILDAGFRTLCDIRYNHSEMDWILLRI